MRGLLGLTTGVCLTAAALFAYRNLDDFGEVPITRTERGAVSCNISEETVASAGGKILMLATRCNTPKGLTTKTSPRAMSYVSMEAALAGDGKHLRCYWREYRSISIWPPSIVSYTTYEDCALEQQI